MTKWTTSSYFLVILVASAMIMNAPSLSLAQNNPPVQVQPGSAARQVPQPVGGVATVVGVDQPDNCLRIRSGPGGSYEVIGCAGMGQQLNITGVWTFKQLGPTVGQRVGVRTSNPNRFTSASRGPCSGRRLCRTGLLRLSGDILLRSLLSP